MASLTCPGAGLCASFVPPAAWLGSPESPLHCPVPRQLPEAVPSHTAASPLPRTGGSESMQRNCAGSFLCVCVCVCVCVCASLLSFKVLQWLPVRVGFWLHLFSSLSHSVTRWLRDLWRSPAPTPAQAGTPRTECLDSHSCGF